MGAARVIVHDARTREMKFDDNIYRCAKWEKDHRSIDENRACEIQIKRFLCQDNNIAKRH